MPVSHSTKRRKLNQKLMQQRRMRETAGPPSSQKVSSHRSDEIDEDELAAIARKKILERQRRYRERRKSPPTVPTSDENVVVAGADDHDRQDHNATNNDNHDPNVARLPLTAALTTLPLQNITNVARRPTRRSSRHLRDDDSSSDDDMTIPTFGAPRTADPIRRHNTRGVRRDYRKLANGEPSQTPSENSQPEPTKKRARVRRTRAPTVNTAIVDLPDIEPVESDQVAAVADYQQDQMVPDPMPPTLPPMLSTLPTVAECLDQILDGRDVTFKLHQLPEVQQATKSFANTICNKTKMFFCDYCCERWFDKLPSSADPTKCKECAKDKNNPLRWSHLNLTDPFGSEGYPHHLPKLTQIEEMLIARSHVVMTCFQVSGGNVQYRGNVLNIQQDCEQIFEYIPLLPTDLPCFIVRKSHQSEASVRNGLQNFRDFRVSRTKLQCWIEFLMAKNPLYRNNVVFNNVNLQQIPENGSIVEFLPIVKEAGVVDNHLNEMDVPNPLELGPAHNGASGIPTEEDPVRHHYLQQPVIQPENQQSIIARYLQDNFVGTAQHPMEWPAGTRYMSEYSDSNLLSSAFPTLYPFGSLGNVTFRDRPIPVSLTDANRHLLKYAIKVPGTEQYCYPFAEHPRWCYYVFNIAERHRCESQRSFFIKKNPHIGNMTVDQIQQLVNNPDRRNEFMQIVSLMQSYNANINGSDSYLYKSRQRLESLIAQEGMPTLYFTLTAADNHWADLHQHFNLAYDPAFNETTKAKLRRKMVRDNPHIVDNFFFLRVQLLLKQWFCDAALPLKWHWFRIEYQERGTAHAHGCLRLECDPNIALLAKKVAEARRLQCLFRRQNIHLDECFSLDETRDDKLLFDPAELQHVFSEQEILASKATIAEGVNAHRIICNFQDFLLTSFHPDPPIDAATNQRDPSTRFDETANNVHPTSVSLFDMTSKSNVEKTDHYCQLINTVERHACQSYCQRSKRQTRNSTNDGAAFPANNNNNDNNDDDEEFYCRFSFPKPIMAKTHLGIQMKWVGSGATKRKHTEIVMNSERNDFWMNSHCRPVMDAWQANMDLQLTIDVGKITQYMTKYMTKAENTIPNSVCGLVRRLLQSAEANGGSSQAVLKRLMSQLLGQRAMCRQETQHLMLSLSIVECSKSFEKVSLTNDSTQIQLPDEEGIVTATSIVEAYAERNVMGKWADVGEFGIHSSHLSTMNLATFCTKFYVLKSGPNRNKIRVRRDSAKEVVIQFYPSRLSALPSSPHYTEYCQYSLMKYKPWENHPKSTYGGESNNPTVEDSNNIKAAWHEFISNRNNNYIPEWFFQELDNLLMEQATIASHRRLQNNLPINQQAAIVENQGEVNNNEPALEWTNAIGNDGHLALVNNEDSDPLESIAWDTTSDRRSNDFDGDNRPVDDLQGHLEEQLNNNQAFVRPVVEYHQLNEKQKLAFQMVVTVVGYDALASSTDGGNGFSRCMILLGLGGTGKSFVINAVVHRLMINALVRAIGDDLVAVMATTGKAASIIGGSTMHDREKGFSLPIGRSKFKNLEGAAEQRLQARFNNTKLLIIDEFSMLKAKELHYINERLKQAKGNNFIFGGIAILLVGDPGQLPAVRGTCLWESLSEMKVIDDKTGGILYTQFLSVIELTENCRVNGSGDEALTFCQLQGRIRDAEVTEDDWHLLKSRSKDTIGHEEWERQGFMGDDVTHLCVRNVEVDIRNLHCLMNLNKPIAKIEALHSGNWLRVSADNFQGLEPVVYLCEGSCIMITNNILSKINITNGTIGVVKNIKFYDADLHIDGSLKRPCLPNYVWVDFGTEYRGETFFPRNPNRNGWVPIFPKEARYWSSSTAETTRTMLPMKLSWAWTIHKAQGQTISGKFVIRLGSREIAAGLTYVAISRARSLQNIGFAGGLSLERVTTKLDSKGIRRRKEHEKVLREREEATVAKLLESITL